ncbi:MAG: PEP-CTERM sorting domain-containing protein [Pseudomonadota bacterium]
MHRLSCRKINIILQLTFLKDPIMLNKHLALLLCACTCAGVASAADPHVETAGFTVDMTEDASVGWHTNDMTLVSDTNNVAKLRLSGLEAWSNMAIDNRTSGWSTSTGDLANGVLNFSLRDGYKITNIEFSANVVGTAKLGDSPQGASDNGLAANSLWLTLTLGTSHGDRSLGSKEIQPGTINGILPVMFDHPNNSVLNHNFVAGIDISEFLQAMPNEWSLWEPGWDHDPIYGSSPSSASLQILNPTLTVTYALAVPEPETYAMMLGGLALLACVARRRKSL